MTTAVELAMIEWAEGARRLAALDEPAARLAVYEAVIGAIVDELQRRLGNAFTLAELAAVYADAAGWCLQVAQTTTDRSFAYDLAIVQDAAFSRFARRASDYR